MTAMDDALQQMKMLVLLDHNRGPLARWKLGDHRIGALPQLGRDQGLVLAGIFRRGESDAATIDGIGDEKPQAIAAKVVAADLLGRPIAANEHARFGAVAVCIQGVGDVRQRHKVGRLFK